MRRLIIALFSAAIVLTSCGKTSSGLEPGNWNPVVYHKLDSVITAEGINGSNYDVRIKPYAVFDFDNTSIINDCEISLLHYMIENMSFKIEPQDMFRAITDCIPDIDFPVIGDNTVRMVAQDITSDYASLYGKEFSEISSSEAYADFRAKLSALYFVTEDFYEYRVCCEWILRLFNGMTISEVEQLSKIAFDYYSTMNGARSVTWESPDIGICGRIAATHLEGIAVTDEMKNLYATLKKNGFDVYICSASLEAIVEAIACCEQSDFSMERDYVFGLRLADEGLTIKDARLDTAYVQTYRQGKTGAIKEYMAPSHGGRGPSIVAGDSNGDYYMLTDFEDMKIGLIINCGNGGGIGELASGSDPKYAVQNRDLSAGKFVR